VQIQIALSGNLVFVLARAERSLVCFISNLPCSAHHADISRFNLRKSSWIAKPVREPHARSGVIGNQVCPTSVREHSPVQILYACRFPQKLTQRRAAHQYDNTRIQNLNLTVEPGLLTCLEFLFLHVDAVVV